MKHLLTFLIVLALPLVIGCSKSSNVDKKDKKVEFVSGFYCKIDGKDFMLADSLTYGNKDERSFTITAKIEVIGGQYDDFFFFINTPIKVGDFNLSKENNPGHVQYNTNQYKQVKSDFDAFWSDAGKLTLTKVDDKTIEGTFSFTVTGKVNDVDKKISITDGKIKVKIN
jgi:hypothetical protein